MNRRIVLDTGVLSLLTHSNPLPEVHQCRQWLVSLLTGGDTVILPEIADYELRRKLLHINSQRSLRRLDDLPAQLVYLPISTPMWRTAAELWAMARRRGRLPGREAELSGDVILAAQALSLGDASSGVVVATMNMRHLAPFADARLWTAI
jgi:predicted nucleic acid-binding protein